ncbi:MAG: hypothetical protein LBK60_09850 [Verrucomicrobiales bacterium]|nr:hypothetical protein [Verrucomicrobiales bacterium]
MTELLAATTILAVVILLLGSFFVQATRTWRDSESKVSTYTEARAALHFLARDLQNVRVTPRLPFRQNPDDVAVPHHSGPAPRINRVASRAERADAVFFLTVSGANTQPAGNRGDLCAAGYYLAYSNGSYNLHRYFKASDETWDDLVKTNPAKVPFPATSDQDDIIARNIAAFSVQRYDAQHEPIPDDDAHTPPATFEIYLLGYNHDTAQKFPAAADWTDPARFTMLKHQNEQLFHLRVNLSSF